MVSILLNGQPLNLDNLISIAESRSNIETDTITLCELYILDGMPYTDPLELVRKLESTELSGIKFTKIVDLSNSEIYCRICDYILLIGTKGNQSRKHKLQQLQLIQTNLNENLPKVLLRDYICDQCRQVVIDGSPINMWDL